jgi:hypothetical protein
MQKTFDLISDPGHGWVKVPKRLLSDLLISKEISRYSYERGAFAYLEEDCDLATFFNAYRQCFGIDPKIRERVAREKRSRVRGYDTYSGGQ